MTVGAHFKEKETSQLEGIRTNIDTGCTVHDITDAL